MSIKIMTWVFYEETQTHGEERLVLLALADQANDEGLTWPGVNRLAQKANTHPRSIPRALHQLIIKLLVTVEPRNDNGRSLTNLYHIIWNEQIRAEEKRAGRLGVSPYKSPISGGEGDTMTPPREGDTVTGGGGQSDTLGVTQRQGEGDTATPESLINRQLTASEPGDENLAQTLWRLIVTENAKAEHWWPARERILTETVNTALYGNRLKVGGSALEIDTIRTLYGIAAQRRRAEIATGMVGIEIEVIE